MNKLRLLALSLLFIFLTQFETNAQYKFAVGARFDGGPGITMKFKNGSKLGAEALIHGYGNGIKGTLLAEWHEPAFNSNKFQFYYGFGGHMGATPGYYYRKREFAGPYFQVGADGILGLEHTFSEIPLNLSVDWKPEFNFINYTGLYLGNIGLSARFAIK